MDDVEILKTREEIRDLYARYAASMDYAHGDDFAMCFTDDGAMKISPDNKEFRGRDALRKFVTAYAQGRPRHIICNLLFDEITQDLARCRAYILLLKAEGGEIVGNGRYEDLIVRDSDSGWRYQEKQVLLEWKSLSYSGRLSSFQR